MKKCVQFLCLVLLTIYEICRHFVELGQGEQAKKSLFIQDTEPWIRIWPITGSKTLLLGASSQIATFNQLRLSYNKCRLLKYKFFNVLYLRLYLYFMYVRLMSLNLFVGLNIILFAGFLLVNSLASVVYSCSVYLLQLNLSTYIQLIKGSPETPQHPSNIKNNQNLYTFLTHLTNLLQSRH